MLDQQFDKRLRKTCTWFDHRNREMLGFSTRLRAKTMRAGNPRGTVTMSQLGRLGRFGNWLFQYMFLKCHALQHGLEAQTPHWPGHYLFDCSDPLIARRLPTFRDQYEAATNGPVVFQMDPPIMNVDFVGYFQYHTSHFAPYKEYLQELLTPRASLTVTLSRSVQRLRGRGAELVALYNADFVVPELVRPSLAETQATGALQCLRRARHGGC